MKNRRGFTLLEMMIAMVIMVFVVAGISQVLIKQSQASSSQSLQRDLEENGRLALLEIARNVRLAGYGITPLAAFDFARYGCTTADDPTTCNCVTANPASATCVSNSRRDRVDGPDELVLSYRDPSFSRTVVSVTAGSPSTVKLSAALKSALSAGTIVELITNSGAAVDYLALNSAAAVGATTLSLRTLTSKDGYYTPSVGMPDTTTYAGAAATLVTRVRYFVANDTDGVPALWKERGNGNELLYRGIEDLQLAYDIGRPPTGSVNASVTQPAATTCATSLTSGTLGWTFGACADGYSQPLASAIAPDWQNDAYDSVNRYSAHPVNIRNVTITVVARSTRASPDKAGDPAPAVGDRPARVADTYKRTILQLAEQPQNLLARQFFMPVVFTSGSEKSVGGG
jgi:prepilin-type N-terminal cleavage/methylation domain-containing protein